MSLSRTVRDLVEQVRREERARLAACVRAWGERLGDQILDGTMVAELADRIERADSDGTLPVVEPPADRAVDARGRVVEHVVAPPFVLDLDE